MVPAAGRQYQLEACVEIVYAFMLTLAAFGGVQITAVQITAEAKTLEACNSLRRLVKVQLMLAGVDTKDLTECRSISAPAAAR